MKNNHETHTKKRIQKKTAPLLQGRLLMGSCAMPHVLCSPMCSYVDLFFSLLCPLRILCASFVLCFSLCTFPYVSLLPVSVLLLTVHAQVVIEPSYVSHPHPVPIEKEPPQTIGVKTVLGTKGVIHLMRLLL